MLGLIIESLVIALLLLTLAYCVLLNRSLARLRNGEQAMRHTISELLAATDQAQRAIIELKQVSSETDKRLGLKLKQGDTLARRLADQIGAGETVIDRVTRIVSAARSDAGVADDLMDHRSTGEAHDVSPSSYRRTSSSTLDLARDLKALAGDIR
ncbi:MAG: DUF6468 domain-containing protein [Pseudomonadota bacterium]